MVVYSTSRLIPGYGCRIFVPYMCVDERVREILDEHSFWNRYDKDTGKAYSWEFDFNRNEDFLNAKYKLRKIGVRVEEINLNNFNQII